MAVRLSISLALCLAAAPMAAQSDCEPVDTTDVRRPRPREAARDSLAEIIRDTLHAEMVDAARRAGVAEPAGIVFVDVQNRRTGAARVWSFRSNVPDSLSSAAVARRAPLLARWPDRNALLHFRLDPIDFPEDPQVECTPSVLNGVEFARDLQEMSGRLLPESAWSGGHLRVHVKLLVTRDGQVAYAMLARRSDYPDADRHVLELAEHLRFRPAHVDHVPVDAWVEQPVVLVLPVQRERERPRP